MSKKKCPKCGSLMPYITGQGYICLNCDYTRNKSKSRSKNEYL